MPQNPELRSIVQRMMEAGENEENIGAVIQRLSGSAPPERIPEPSSAVNRFAGELYQKSPLPTVVGLVKGTANVAMNPLETWGGLKPLGGVARDIYDASAEQAGLSREAYQRGDSLAALGRGAAALPMVGPTVADIYEHFASGDIAGGIGGAIGFATPLKVKAIQATRQAGGIPTPSNIRAGRARTAARTRAAAEQQVAREVLAPATQRYAGSAADLAPKVLDDPRFKNARTQSDISAVADSIVDDALARMDTFAPTTYTSSHVRPFVRQLEQVIDAQKIPTGSMGSRTLSGLEPMVDALTIRLNEMRRMGGRSQRVPDAGLLQLRQQLDGMLRDAKAYKPGTDLRLDATVKATKRLADDLRGHLAEKFPEFGEAAKDFSRARQLQDVMDPALGRPKAAAASTGTTGGPLAAGAIIGQGLGPFGAAASAWGMLKLRNWIQSPEYRLLDARKQAAYAAALKKNDVGRLRSIVDSVQEGRPITAATQAARGAVRANVLYGPREDTAAPVQMGKVVMINGQPKLVTKVNKDDTFEAVPVNR
jgi:hypothetical protein